MSAFIVIKNESPATEPVAFVLSQAQWCESAGYTAADGGGI